MKSIKLLKNSLLGLNMSLPEINVKHHVLMDKLKATRAASIESSKSWKSSMFFSTALCSDLVVSGWQLRVFTIGEDPGFNIAANPAKVLVTMPPAEKPLAMLVISGSVCSNELPSFGLPLFCVGIWFHHQLLTILVTKPLDHWPISMLVSYGKPHHLHLPPSAYWLSFCLGLSLGFSRGCWCCCRRCCWRSFWFSFGGGGPFGVGGV